MKFHHIIEAVYFQPWSITDAGWWSIHRIVKPHLLGSELPSHVREFIAGLRSPEALAVAADDQTPDTDFFGQPIETMQVTPEGLAVVPVFGPLINHASLMDRLCGACSYQQIQNDLRTARATAGLKRVVMKIGSPGGMCNGMAETCREIMRVREAGIPIKAISDTVIGSAAFGLAASCDSIGITETTMVGSIGSFCAVLDSSKAHEMAGLKVEVIKSGELKGEVSGTSLSKERRANIQNTVDYVGNQFREIVRQGRMIDESLMQGQVFIGTEAIANGFADMMIEDMGDGYAADEDDD